MFLFVLFYCNLAVESENRRNCRYPAWFLAHSHWQTLDGRWTYSLHKNSTLRIVNVTAHHGATPAPTASPSLVPTIGVDSRQEQKAVCHSSLDLTDGEVRIVTHLSQGWCVPYTIIPSSLSPSLSSRFDPLLPLYEAPLMLIRARRREEKERRKRREHKFTLHVGAIQLAGPRPSGERDRLPCTDPCKYRHAGSFFFVPSLLTHCKDSRFGKDFLLPLSMLILHRIVFVRPYVSTTIKPDADLKGDAMYGNRRRLLGQSN